MRTSGHLGTSRKVPPPEKALTSLTFHPRWQNRVTSHTLQRESELSRSAQLGRALQLLQDPPGAGTGASGLRVQCSFPAVLLTQQTDFEQVPAAGRLCAKSRGQRSRVHTQTNPVECRVPHEHPGSGLGERAGGQRPREVVLGGCGIDRAGAARSEHSPAPHAGSALLSWEAQLPVCVAKDGQC